MLLEGLDDDVVSLFRVAHRGIEELLLDLRVDLELGLQFGKELLPVALALFELGENLLHLAVVGLQQRDRIHLRRLVVEEQQPDDQQDKQKRPDSEVRSVAVHSNLHNSDMSNTDIDTIRLGARSATTRTGKEQPLTAQMGGLKLVAQLPDAVDVATAARVDAVAAYPGQALVVRGQNEPRIVQLVEVGAKQCGPKLGIVDRIRQIDP